MTLRSDRREWDDLAARDAMWAVYSRPELRGRWDPQDFMASGEAEVAAVLAGLEAEGLAPARRRRALDFGCGLGRLSRALATRFDEVVGVDLSERMVAEARRLSGDRANCRFLPNPRPDLAALPSDEFDLVFSLIALQHVSSRAAIRTYIREFARVAAPGGVLAFQLPVRVSLRLRAHPLRLANRLVRRLPWAPGPVLNALMPHSMRLSSLPEREVRTLLEASGARVHAAFSDGRGGTPLIESFFYVAQVPGPRGSRGDRI